MKPTGELFTIRHDNKQVAVDTYKFQGGLFYHIKFDDQQPIFITKTVDAKLGEETWMPVPEGNLKLAIEIGKAIDERDITLKQTKLF